MFYKGHFITKSNTTTDANRTVFGKSYRYVATLYTIDGPHLRCPVRLGGPVSVAAAKRMINQAIDGGVMKFTIRVNARRAVLPETTIRRIFGGQLSTVIDASSPEEAVAKFAKSAGKNPFYFTATKQEVAS